MDSYKGYVPKKKIKEYKDLFHEIFNKVRIDLKSDLSLTYTLIGSSKRNLVLDHHNRGFDCDYDVNLTKVKNEDLSDKEIDEMIHDAFKCYLEEEGYQYDGRTHKVGRYVLKNNDGTTKHSYEIAISREDPDSDDKQILASVNNGLSWESTVDRKEFRDKYSQINGAKDWNALRGEYKDLKNSNTEKKKSISLLMEATNNVLNNK